ncbi:hypothetical protein G5714_011725 [Onychostoma macrolepis]|uniref:Uncharacterized protein n=1 Tax=Onychostoma macrolepis TaxID=369639 RepID=A0A7J6CJL2_9TELE|nr:hypothetical protein G5714_011725 [Onychostoma macrolepis]
MCMEQRRCSIKALELQEKLYEEWIDIEQKGSDSLIFGKNEREKKRITGVILCSGSRPSGLADLPADSLLSSCFSAHSSLTVPCHHPANAQKSKFRRANFLALLQMPHHFCRSGRAPLHTADGHGKCVSCLGAAHTETALTETECSHCEDMSLASLRSLIAFFSENDSAHRTLPLPSSQEPVRKKQRGRGCKLTPTQTPRTSLSPTREVLPVFFSRPDQRPSVAACNLVSFGGSEDEVLDDSVSLAASDAEEPSGSQHSPVRKGPLQWQTLPETHGSSTAQPGCKGLHEDPSDPAARSML